MIDVQAVKESVSLEEAFDFLGIAWPISGRRHPVVKCPLHEERTPSFTLYPEKDRWWCYGCNKGGDVVDLVMAERGIDFTDALRALAEYKGVAETVGPHEPKDSPKVTLSAVADQAHADVLGWIPEDATVEHREEMFSFYDEILRAERAGEITANAAIREIVAWRMKWKQRLR